MRWLIVEDSLRDRRGHWYEYIASFYHELRRVGDEVTVLVDRKAGQFIIDEFHARPVLPPSIWDQATAAGSALRRMLRLPWHAWQTCRAVRPFLRARPACDIVFVPTVAVHHLLAWALLVKGPLRHSNLTVLLVFIHLPLQWDESRQAVAWTPSLTSRLLRRLLRWLRPEIQAGRVVVAAEPATLQHAFATAAQLPVLSVPQPVHRYVRRRTAPGDSAGTIMISSFGGARAEKGSDLLQRAILAYLERNPDANVRFSLQWGEDFVGDDGRLVQLDPRVATHPQVVVLPRFFVDDEHAEALARTDAMIAPYRLASYRLRGSRVALEAMVNGLPLITTRDSSMAGQLREHGAGVLFDDGSVDSLVEAIAGLRRNYPQLRELAGARQEAARLEYSVSAFRRTVVKAAETRAKPSS